MTLFVNQTYWKDLIFQLVWPQSLEPRLLIMQGKYAWILSNLGGSGGQVTMLFCPHRPVGLQPQVVPLATVADNSGERSGL